jgi:transcription antitermination factor NusG
MQKLEQKKWHVIYTKPRWEKKVHALLEARNIESFCPINRTIKKWSDRNKKVNMPLFPSYGFVYILEEEKLKVREIPGVVNFVYWLKKPAIIRSTEIEKIRNFVEKYENIELAAADYKIGNKLTIEHISLGKLEGVISEVSKHKIELIVKSLNIKLIVNKK